MLTQAISSCDIKIGLKSSDCVLKDRDTTDKMYDYAQQNWFLNGYCATAVVGGDYEDGICYHTSTGRTAFTS